MTDSKPYQTIEPRDAPLCIYLFHRLLPRSARRIFLLPGLPGAGLGGGEEEGPSSLSDGRVRGGGRGLYHPRIAEHGDRRLDARRGGSWAPVEIASSTQGVWTLVVRRGMKITPDLFGDVSCLPRSGLLGGVRFTYSVLLLWFAVVDVTFFVAVYWPFCFLRLLVGLGEYTRI